MKFLKQRITRIIAFAAACIIVAACALSVTKALLSHEKLISGGTDYMSSYEYDYDLNELYRQLWIVGNMYLRNIDEKGDFTGTPEFRTSTENVLTGLGLMDSSGNITVADDGNFEYYLSFGGSVLSNTDKNYGELYNAGYSLVRKNDMFEDIPDTIDWCYDDYYWYSTNYGMYYYYFGQGAAVFDFDTSDLDYYVDNNGAKIFYKTDGTTPLPFAEDGYVYDEYDEYDEYAGIQEPTMDQESFENIQNGGFLIYNADNGKWIHVDNDRFVTLPGDESQLTICITPKSLLIESHEQAMLEYSSEMSSFVHLLVNLIPFAVIALILTIYVLITGGYSVKEGKFVLGRFDRIFGEFPFICIIAALMGGVALVSPDVIAVLRELFIYYYNEDMLMPIVYSIAYMLIFAVIIAMLDTLFIRVKCRCFWKTTLIGRIISWVLIRLKMLCKKLRSEFISKEMLRSDIFTRKFIRRIILFVILGLLAVMVCVAVESVGVLIFCAVILLAGYVFLSFYDLKALTMLGEQISDMNGGDYSRREVSEGSVIYGMTEKLNNISDGIQTAVERQIKSERMKIDLVTNVSHDLKTPLTSIISYINLLSMEELTPEARDYVKILEQKSERLRAIVSDLFDLAKATSGTDIQSELIDAVVLVQQVLGDMSDKISKYGREIRTDIAMENAPVYAEGKKLYRVLQNLIDNALKYSLDGTRIYLILREEEGKVVIVLKNISSYEMKFTPDEITERFTRGDESRTSEGNGLGLSIAKSFTEACGGEFRVIVDGDVFAAELRLPLTGKKDTTVPDNTDA